MIARLLVLGLATPLVVGCDAHCDSRREAYYASLEAANQCDPTAAVPCTAYQGVECPPAGVRPESVDALSAKLSDYTAACGALPEHSCPAALATPAPYVCQAKADGVPRCYSPCEEILSGHTACVSQPLGCAPNVELPQGYCSGTSMSCCSQ